MMSCGGLGEAVLGGFGGQRLRVGGFGLRFLLAHDLNLDGGLDFAQRLGVRRLALLDLDDVVAELGVDERYVADLVGEDGGVEFRDHGAATGKAQFPALRAAAGIFGVLLGEIGEVGSALNLLEEMLRPWPWLRHRS